MAGYPAKKNAAYVFAVGLVSQANPATLQANPTLASGDVKVAIDDGAFANLATLPTVTPASGKRVKVSLSADEMNGDVITVVFSDAAGNEWNDLLIVIHTSVRQIDDLAYPTTSGRSIDVTTTGEVGIDWANIGSPTTTVNLSGTTVKTATDVEADTQDIQSRLPAALTAGGNIKADALALSGDTVAADNAESFFDGTGYAGTNNVIPLVTTTTTATNVTTVNGLAAGVITSASIAADAITAAKIADGAIDTATFAAGTTIPRCTLVDTCTTNTDMRGTDNALLASSYTAPLSAAGTRTAIGMASANLDTQLAVLDTDILTRLATASYTAPDNTSITAIKAKTDSLNFTTAGFVDANVQYVNDVQVKGTGTTASPWGPA